MPAEYTPDRGDVVWITLDPQAGREQAGRRPAVVLSSIDYNGTVGLALVCPVTSRVKGYPFEVPIPAGQSASGVVLTDHLKSLDWKARRVEYIGRLPDDLVNLIRATVRSLL